MKRLITALPFLCLALSAGAEDAALTQETFQDWSVVKGAAGCLATLSVGLKQPSSGLATVTLLPRDGGGAVPAVMSVQVPLGASLRDGIAYTHGGAGEEAVGLGWQYCTARTCVATGGVSQDELKRLKAGREIYLGFVPLPGSRSLIVPVSLLGLTRSWAAVEACE